MPDSMEVLSAFRGRDADRRWVLGAIAADYLWGIEFLVLLRVITVGTLSDNSAHIKKKKGIRCAVVFKH